ncbi:MAG: hypothetical protein LC772_06665 [Chloroflexi bacterium]|nr:hypothetical protein [Chloroflexota bacterium]
MPTKADFIAVRDQVVRARKAVKSLQQQALKLGDQGEAWEAWTYVAKMCLTFAGDAMDDGITDLNRAIDAMPE